MKTVLFIVICTFCWDRVGFNGCESGLTPNMDRLAADSVVFSQAVSAAPWTRPSVTSIVTGLTPNVHRISDDAKVEESTRRLPEGVITVAEVFKDMGFTTVGYYGNMQVSPIFNIHQGYDIYEFTKVDKVTSEKAISALDQADENPLFLFLLFKDTHNPYQVPYEYYERLARHPAPSKKYKAWCRSYFEGLVKKVNDNEIIESTEIEQLRDMYDAALLYTDSCIGKVLDELKSTGMYEDTLIVLCGDHGEEFYEHDRLKHAGDFYDTLVRVPLLIKMPQTRPQQVDSQVRTIDIFPTLAEVFARDMGNYPLQGKSLLSIMRGAEDQDRPAISSHEAFGNSLRHNSWKLIEKTKARRKKMLFDLKNDPHELNNIWSTQPKVRKAMQEQLNEIIRKEEELSNSFEKPKSIAIDAATMRGLKALGYIK